MNRRDFLSGAGASALGALMPVAAARASSGEKEGKLEDAALSDDFLRGVCDIHVHAAPDVKLRSINEFELCKKARSAGYRAVMLKSNV